MRTGNRFTYKITAALFAAVCLFSVLVSGSGAAVVHAATFTTSGYSDVLDDLKKDSSFKVADYPESANYYLLQVIQIAESTDGELFVYVYNPCGNKKPLTATEINMSLTNKMGGVVDEKDELSSADSPKLYGLTLLSRRGVFGKYKVNDFAVSNQATRYYNIASIYREWDSNIDNPATGASQAINEVAFTVGKLYTATTENGEVQYSCKERKTIDILNPFWGYQRYTDGFLLSVTACDSHYVAFSTDMKIDELYEADLFYQSRGVHRYYNLWEGHGTRYDEWQSQYAFLTDEQEFVKKRTGWLWGSEAKYNRIQSSEQFIKSETLSDEAKKTISDLQWVLRFVETDFYYNHDASCGDWTEVSEVTILRLKFKSDGVVYNLGAVSDKGTEAPYPTNPPQEVGFWEYIWNCIVKLFTGTATGWETFVAVATIIVGLAVISLLIKILSLFIPFFVPVWNTIWCVIFAPFRGIAWLFKKIFRRG